MCKKHRPGPETNARVAAEVMGWPVFIATDPEWRMQLHGKGIQCVRFISPPAELRRYEGMRFVDNWRPSTDIADAWEVLGKLTSVKLDRLDSTDARFSIDKQWQCYADGHWGVAETAPMAICNTALAAGGE